MIESIDLEKVKTAPQAVLSPEKKSMHAMLEGILRSGDKGERERELSSILGQYESRTDIHLDASMGNPGFGTPTERCARTGYERCVGC